MDVMIRPAIKPTICVLGGTGFVGRHLAAHLSEKGYPVRIPSRRAERHRELQVLTGIELLSADVHDDADLRRVLSGCEAVVNLVAILNENRRGQFEAVHVGLVERLIEACRATGVRRLLHVSAVNADTAARGGYQRTKAEGEQKVMAASDLDVTVFRPSLIFGPEDHLFTRFARLLRISPGFFPLACPEARFAPVFVGDVAHALHVALEDTNTIGQRYELCGPRVYTLRQIVSYAADTLDLERRIVGLGDGLSQLQARIMGLLPGKPFTMDNYHSLKSGGTCSGPFPDIFGIEPTPVESVVPIYLGANDERARLDEARRTGRHAAG